VKFARKMWMRRCAACRRLLRKSKLCDQLGVSAVGNVAAMAQQIEFYVPEKFRRQGGQWIAPEQRGKIIPFPHRNRSLHNMKTLRLVCASDKSSWPADPVFCSPQNVYLDW
jgi:hypothetical protein